MPAHPPPYRYEEFDAAVARLLGAELCRGLKANGINRPGLCELVAKQQFVGALAADAGEDDLAIVRWVAANLWCGDGSTGLAG